MNSSEVMSGIIEKFEDFGFDNLKSLEESEKSAKKILSDISQTEINRVQDAIEAGSK